MKLKHLLFTFLILAITCTAFGNDSTLHQQRVARIKQLAIWLKSRPMPLANKDIHLDNIKACPLYDTAIGLFLTKRPVEEKFHPKTGLLYFDVMVDELPMDSMLLKLPQPRRETLEEVKSFTSYLKNTVVLYVPMYNDEFETIYFSFADNSADLIHILEAGGDEKDYLAKKRFINNLNPLSK